MPLEGRHGFASEKSFTYFARGALTVFARVEFTWHPPEFLNSCLFSPGLNAQANEKKHEIKSE
jgi:hypothetical protein